MKHLYYVEAKCYALCITSVTFTRILGHRQHVTYFVQGHKAESNILGIIPSLYSLGFPYSLLLHLKNAEDTLHPESHSLKQASERKTSK